jgi:hypothetical protein
MWTVSESTAELQNEDLHLRVDAARPYLGIGNVVASGWGVPGLRALAISQEPSIAPGTELLSEIYTRGDDFIVHYAESPTRDTQARIRWRDISRELGFPGIQVGIEMQTRWLESHPGVEVRSSLSGSEGFLFRTREDWRPVTCGPQAENLTAASGVFLFRPAGIPLSYLEMVYPSDFQRAWSAFPGSEAGVVYRLFPEFLEKGVIRVGRIAGVWIPRRNDQAVADETYARFRVAPASLSA